MRLAVIVNPDAGLEEGLASKEVMAELQKHVLRAHKIEQVQECVSASKNWLN